MLTIHSVLAFLTGKRYMSSFIHLYVDNFSHSECIHNPLFQLYSHIQCFTIYYDYAGVV
jgi:hypothetical protein